jgi:integrase
VAKPNSLTKAWLDNVKSRAEAFDMHVPGREGLVVRVHPSGAKSFRMRYSFDGRRPWITFGEYGAQDGISLAEAFDQHHLALKELALGLDPAAEREKRVEAARRAAEKERATNSVTTRNVIAEWAWHHARHSRKRPREAVRLLRVYVATPWKGRPVSSLRRRDAVLLFDAIKSRGARVMANRIQSLALQAFNLAVARDLIINNPFVGTNAPGGGEKSKERYLSDEEIKVFWNNCGKLNHRGRPQIGRRLELGLKFILVTGQRPGEVAQARIEEFDRQRREWTIPPEHIKTEERGSTRSHVVPLSDLALEIFSELLDLADGRPCLLPSAHKRLKSNKPINEKTLAHALSNLVIEDKDGKETLLGLAPFSPHVLRRSCATGMTSLKISRFDVGKVLNHSDGRIAEETGGSKTTATYDKYAYFEEKLAALNTWATHLQKNISE